MVVVVGVVEDGTQVLGLQDGFYCPAIWPEGGPGHVESYEFTLTFI